MNIGRITKPNVNKKVECDISLEGLYLINKLRFHEVSFNCADVTTSIKVRIVIPQGSTSQLMKYSSTSCGDIFVLEYLFYDTAI